MEYQKIANLLDNEVVINESNQPSKFRARNWIELNDESRGTYTGDDIKFKTTILMSSLFDYEEAYIIVKRTVTITGARVYDAAKRLYKRDKGVIFKKLCTIQQMHKQNKQYRDR